MLWRLQHYLFGTHYVAVQLCYEWYIKRVYETPNLDAYIKFADGIVFLDDPDYKFKRLT